MMQDRINAGKEGDRTPAVVLGLGPNGLGVARSLGVEGIPVVGVELGEGSPGGRSKYLSRTVRLEHSRVPDLVDSLGDRELVLLPCSDHMVRILSENRELLPGQYRCTLPEMGVVETLMDKALFAREAERCGLPVPKTAEFTDVDDITRACGDLGFPCVLKPCASEEWRTADAIRALGGAKAIDVASMAAVRKTYARVRSFSRRVVVQERIAGPDSSLYSVLSYVDRSGSPVCAFVGRKWRMLPVHAGVGTLVESVKLPDLVSITLESLGRMGYVGASGVCFKRDGEGEFKAFEVNLRTNMWNSLALACGVNVPLAIWRDTLGLPVEAVRGYRSGVRWLDLLNDISAFRAYRREGEWSFLRYLDSLRSVRAFAYLDLRDPVPFLDRWAAEAASLLHRSRG